MTVNESAPSPGATIASSSGPTENSPSSSSASHRRSLDGLRALAVAAVVVYHFTSTSAHTLGRGGFLGVDLFFVLSGFLITGLLLAEHSKAKRIDLKSFWQRRFRRLFPAFVVFLGLIALFVMVSPAFARSGIRGDTIWSLLYVQNWHYLYWQSSVLDPVSHTWSLSVEEQWYLIWPAALWATLYWTKGRIRTILIIFLGLAGASAIWTFFLHANVGWTRAYYGTDSRAQELLIGAALAVLVSSGDWLRSRWSRWILEIVGWASVIFITSEVIWGDKSNSFFYEGGFVLISIAAACIIAASIYSKGPLGKALSWRPLVLLGLISYGVYLFHIPIMFYLKPGRWGLEGVWLFLVRVALVLLIATASYVLIENPIRRQKFSVADPRVWIPGATVLAVSLGVIMTVGNVPPPSTTVGLFVAAGDAAQSKPVRVMVIGEAPSTGLISISPYGYETKKVSAVTYGFFGCGFMRGVTTSGTTAYLPGKDCEAWPSVLEQVIPAFSPTVVALVVGSQEIYDRTIDGTPVPLGSRQWSAQLDSRLEKARSIAEANGAKVVIVRSTCPNAWAPVPGLESQNADPARYALVGLALQRYAATNHVALWNLDTLLCPDGKPLRTLDGQAVSHFSSGLTRYGSALTWQWIADRAQEPSASRRHSSITRTPAHSSPPA